MMHSKKNLIIGLGKSGLSMARYFFKEKIPFDVLEENQVIEPMDCLNGSMIFNQLESSRFNDYDQIYLSPGINPNLPRFELVREKLSNELNLFNHSVKKKCIAITGSNGKTTLVHLLEAVFLAAGYKALAIGNNGISMLDHVHDELDYFVLELSSYQLELAQPFFYEVSYVSNLSQDHLDRHKTMPHYASIKSRIYQHCRYAVINEEDEYCKNMRVEAEKKVYISLKQSHQLPLLKMIGAHNKHNALAVMSIAELLNLDSHSVREALASFPGLEHRCEFILEKNKISWWNDSKGTNIDSTIVAMKSVGDIIAGKLIMILGGQGKGQDFSILVPELEKKSKAVILFGECKYELEQLIHSLCPDLQILVKNSLEEVVLAAKKIAQTGDAVLLSPACASLDMFRDFTDRGHQFKSLVKKELE